MAAEDTLETLAISQEAIDRVDAELGVFDDFRREEMDYLHENNGSLRMVVMNLFELAIQRGGEDVGRQAMAGSLFASRVLRYAADDTATALPRIGLVDHGMKLKGIADKLVPKPGEEIDYAEFEKSFAGQQAVLDRLARFKNPISRMAATAIFMLHGDALEN